MGDLQLLSQLQELDLQIEAKNVALHGIESTLGDTGELTTARAQVESLRGVLHDQEQHLRELEWDVDELNRHVTNDETKLYKGDIKNPKELDSLQKDLTQQQSRRGQIEDRELQLLSDVEATQAKLQTAQDELKRMTEVWEERQRDLLARQVTLTEELVSIRGARTQIGAAMAPANIALYELLRKEKRGRAVAKVERSICLACRIALPMGVVQRARAGRDFVYCPSCGRILSVQ